MENKEVRRRNLLWIKEQASQHGKGTWETLAEKYGTKAAYLMQIASETTDAHMGDKLARKIEAAESKPSGWMDAPQFEIADRTLLSPDEQKVLARYRYLNDTGKHEALGYLAYLKSRTATVSKERLRELDEELSREDVKDEY